MSEHDHPRVVWQTAINPVVALELLANDTWRHGHAGPLAQACDLHMKKMPAPGRALLSPKYSSTGSGHGAPPVMAISSADRSSESKPVTVISAGKRITSGAQPHQTATELRKHLWPAPGSNWRPSAFQLRGPQWGPPACGNSVASSSPRSIILGAAKGLLQFGEPIVAPRIAAVSMRVRLYFHPIAVPAGDRSL